ncbi:MAG TPA: hypothetical protein VK541_24805 [Pedobacter sp.]|uniref:hypothetical protein n=1 Tax=Pedobacter sp. TaxID=1411316 RepID=UPI002C7CBE18|nr:hypothetical protein [Pedobacter sp.]HMI05732.1 hypothetical protein [Pedobacter sp.]
MLIEQNWSNLTNYIKAGYKSNAFAPFVWVSGLIFIFLFTFFTISDDQIIRYVLIGAFILVIVFNFVIYLILIFKDPRLLQSENYRLEDKKLDMITQKGSDFIIKPVDLVPPTNQLLREGDDNE